MAENPYENCVQVGPSCPVEATTYGYYPSIGSNSVFLAVFIVTLLANVALAYFYRLWTYSFALSAGAALELVGYIGRLRMHSNPWSKSAFTMQIVCLILAPSFVAASIYLTFKHLIIAYGPEFSRLKPRLYTWIFIGCDAISILLQAAGGGVASSNDRNISDVGNKIMLSGIIFQVATMTVCGLLAVEFSWRLYQNRTNVRPVRMGNRQHTIRLPVFCITSMFAYTVILIRCIYRIPEMAGGWGGELTRHEGEFLLLDGM